MARESFIKIGDYNTSGDVMNRTFKQLKLSISPSLSNTFSLARLEVINKIPVLVNFMQRIKFSIKDRLNFIPIQ